jgi:hypothetical protein
VVMGTGARPRAGLTGLRDDSSVSLQSFACLVVSRTDGPGCERPSLGRPERPGSFQWLHNGTANRSSHVRIAALLL